jgi:micrococcal nuclease
MAIAELSARGIIDGYSDGTFGPDDPVWRQHFAKMIVLTLGLPVVEGNSSPFLDVPRDPNNLYPDDYIRVAASYGIATGYLDGTFRATNNVTRAQVIAMVVRATESEYPGWLRDPPSWYEATWGDFDPTHGQLVAKAEFNGLLVGLPLAGMGPWDAMPRGEVCLILSNLLRVEHPGDGEVGLVTSVVDGDTIHAQVGSQDICVRLIGIDTPEMEEPYSQEAKEALTSLVGGKLVRLETDVEERDQYGRMLAYVWTANGLLWEMANEQMLRRGLASLYTVPPNVKYAERLQIAQDMAEEHGYGMWGDAGTCPLEIVSINYDAPGNDNGNLNEEYVTFHTLVSGSLIGYAVEDATGHRYEFPDRIFQKGEVFRLRTGTGADSQTDLYWGASGSAIWNNSGDTVKVLDPRGQILLSFSY